MASFTAPGNNITQRIVFNQGNLDFGSNRIVELQSITLRVEWTIADLYVLGSIKRQDIARHTQKVTVTGKILSFPAEAEQIALGSLSSGSPMAIYTLDGEPTLANPVLTITDKNSKEIQYQLINAIYKSTQLSAREQAYAEWDFEIEAIDIIEVYTA